MIVSRRAALSLPLLALPFPAPAAPPKAAPPAPDFAGLKAAIAKVEAGTGGQIGLAVRRANAPLLFSHRADTRFAMCSTFKLPLVAHLLHSGLPLTERIPITAADMIDHAPVTSTLIGQSASLSDLAAAALITSDNPAANLLLARLGGPQAHTAWLRRLGDRTTRLDRTEPSLNTAIPGDPRDTTTPQAMLILIHKLLFGEILSAPARSQLLSWMHASQTGNAMVRAALPKGWKEANKTGAGGHNTRNIISLITPPAAPPILLTLYMDNVGQSLAARDAHVPPLTQALLASIA